MDNEFDPLPASEPISPELVLVDPELAARVRRNAIAGPSFAASDRASQPPPVEGIPLPVVSHDATSPLPRRRAARRAPARIGWAVTLVALVGVLGAAFAGPRNPPTLIEPTPAPSTPQTIVLGWERVGSATYYILEILRDGSPVHVQRVAGTRISPPTTLAPGRYTWSVRPAWTSGGNDRVGEPSETGWFVVTK